MSTIDWDRAIQIFEQAQQAPEADRESLVGQLACGDEALAAAVLRMLDPAIEEAKSDASQIAELARAEWERRIGAKSAADTEQAPTRIGPYVILSKIGEGGFGVVWLAEQREPVRRRVAIKVIKPGMDSAAVVNRFKAEQQALAMMNHPNIAKVFDAGTTERGLPYFVMEHVAGEPVTKYCDRQRLSITERLELFATICDAVHHAHMKGLIHRDIKPSNILVAVSEQGPRPVVIDFGIAKALNQRLTEATIFTAHGQMIGTPEYMSPEQAEMLETDIDTRSDIYSLGVLLYELLTGALPFERESLLHAAHDEMRRIIREVEPPKPSTRMTTQASAQKAAEARQTKVDDLAKTLRKELEWIPLYAMRKDRTHRYQSASEFAGDVRNYLNGKPLIAGPESRWYLTRKYVRRHRGAVIAVTAILSALLCGFSATAWQWRKAVAATEVARISQRDANTRAEELNRVLEFQREQLSDVDVSRFGGHIREVILRLLPETLTATGWTDERRKIAEAAVGELNFTSITLGVFRDDVLKRTLASINRSFPAQQTSQTLVRARLLQIMATTYQRMGLIDLAFEPQTEALEIRERELGVGHADTLTSVEGMGELLHATGHLAEAEQCYLRALHGRRQLVSEERAALVTLCNMAELLGQQGNYERAETTFTKAIEDCRRVLGDRDPQTLGAMRGLGELFRSRGRLEEADRFLFAALNGYRDSLGGEDSNTLSAITSMGHLRRAQSRLGEAEHYYREALHGRRRVLGDEHSYTLGSMTSLGVVLGEEGMQSDKLSEAAGLLRRAMQMRMRLLGGDHPETVITTFYLALVLARRSDPEADVFFQEAIKGSSRVLGDEHPLVAGEAGRRGYIIRELGRFSEAEPFYRDAVKGCTEVLGEAHRYTLCALNSLAVLLSVQGRLDEAEPIYRSVLGFRLRTLGDSDPDTQVSLSNLGLVLRDMERFPEAEPLLVEAMHAVATTHGRRSPQTLRQIEALISLYDAWDEMMPGSGHNHSAETWRSQLPSEREASKEQESSCVGGH